MHGKEQVIAPRLEPVLGVRCQLPDTFNSDCFGTFTGETKRPGTALETARAKVREALRLTGASLGLASEGSFGPHPYFPFLAADTELIVLIDEENGLEFSAEVLSTATNYAHQAVGEPEELEDFAKAAHFPSHALILRSGTGEFVKGITDWPTLLREAERLLWAHPALTVETDMRAMHNPSRMAVIAECTDALLNKLTTSCPACGWFGYALAERLPGLPCGQCGLPTRTIRADVYRCWHCNHAEEKPTVTGEPYADPLYCDFCNP